MSNLTEKEVVEGIKMIACHMGYKFNTDPKLNHHNITKPNEDGWYYASWNKSDFDNHLLTRLRYHSSWDSLMPVIANLLKAGKIRVSLVNELLANDIKGAFSIVAESISCINKNTPTNE